MTPEVEPDLCDRCHHLHDSEPCTCPMEPSTFRDAGLLLGILTGWFALAVIVELIARLFT